MLWALPHPGDLVFRQWHDDENVVVFEPISGDTHMVDEFGLRLLQLVHLAPRTAQSLAQQLADFFEDVNEAGIAEHVEATLGRYQQLGIVVSKSP